MLKKLLFYLTNRFILVIIMIGIMVTTNYLFSGKIIPSTDTKDFWFYSGMLMLLFSNFFIEPFYTSPKNIITNILPLILSYIAIKSDFKNPTLWWYTFTFLLVCMPFSIVAIAINSENDSPEKLNNRIAFFIRKYISLIGNGKIIYSIVFISVIFLYKQDLDNQFGEHYFLFMIILWGFILAIDPKFLHSKFKADSLTLDLDSVGIVFSVQSNNMYLVKLFEDKNNLLKFDLVYFRYSSEGNNEIINQGIIFDTYKLNSEKWAKVICLGSTVTMDLKIKKILFIK